VAGVEVTYWTGNKWDSEGNYATTVRKVKVEDVDERAIADILRAAARDLERASGLRE
jgi:hypothetical protein